MARGYSNDPRRIVRLKRIKRGNGPLIPPARPLPPPKPAPPARKPQRPDQTPGHP